MDEISSLAGTDLFGVSLLERHKSILASTFEYPPLSLLNAREDWWSLRRDRWLQLLDDAASPGPSRMKPGKVFDPVLAELLVRWYCPVGGSILDLFAGDASRGIVSAVLGFDYDGYEVNERKVQAMDQAAKRAALDPLPRWIAGDALSLVDASDATHDLLIVDPPVPLSTTAAEVVDHFGGMTPGDYARALDEAVSAAGRRCAKNSFAAVIVDHRHEANWRAGPADSPPTADGAFMRLVANVMAGAGYRLHDSAIVLRPLGTVALRARSAFIRTRTLGCTHSTVWVFVKGDPSLAAANANQGQTAVD